MWVLYRFRMAVSSQPGTDNAASSLKDEARILNGEFERRIRFDSATIGDTMLAIFSLGRLRSDG